VLGRKLVGGFAGIMHAAENDDGDDNDMTTREALADSCGGREVLRFDGQLEGETMGLD
jgi:hypothetical protein